MYFSHKKCILQVSPKKTHIIQLLNTKTNTTDVLGNKFYKTQSLFFYLIMWTHIYHWSVLSDYMYFLSCPCNGSGFGSATSKILGNFTIWKHGLYHITEAIRTRKWHIVVNYIQCPKYLCPNNIVVGRQKSIEIEWWGDLFLFTPPSCDVLQSLCVSWYMSYLPLPAMLKSAEQMLQYA